jgi:hypothetical protein
MATLLVFDLPVLRAVVFVFEVGFVVDRWAIFCFVAVGFDAVL